MSLSLHPVPFAVTGLGFTPWRWLGTARAINSPCILFSSGDCRGKPWRAKESTAVGWGALNEGTKTFRHSLSVHHYWMLYFSFFQQGLSWLLQKAVQSVRSFHLSCEVPRSLLPPDWSVFVFIVSSIFFYVCSHIFLLLFCSWTVSHTSGFNVFSVPAGLDTFLWKKPNPRLLL